MTTRAKRGQPADEPEPQLNPALVPDTSEDTPVEKTYRVTGTQPVHNTYPGDSFTATLPLEQEQQLLWGGHITIIEEA